MEEKTDLEKETFGKVKFDELSVNESEDLITRITKFYLDLRDPKELLNQCI